MTKPTVQSPGRPSRRRAVRPSDAANIDRSWDREDALEVISNGGRSPQLQDSGEQPAADPQQGLSEEFWKSQRPPHWG
ncbi:hypothetical protein [Corynebacterium argentoratense]|uniref:hypothetical protein n=1 Tax=Corynebacterium argentoratense TaxID=42817 RepID=UPI001F375A83|nr:hypothetical protein [Corynebacterium argentoratense]MCF1765123.1 hypothetical protein [Corynebacterium argentoratense]